MSMAKMLKMMQQGCLIAVVCLSPVFAQVTHAAEVKPISVEVVGEPGSTQIVTPAPTGQPPVAVPAPSAPAFHYDLTSHWSEMLEDLLIPVLAILLIFGGPVLLIIVIAVLRYRTTAQREKARSENIARLLEAGRDVPLELLDHTVSERKDENMLRKGITNLGVGIGITIFLVNFLGIGIGSVGFIVIGLGVAQLVIWQLASPKQAPVDKNGGDYRS